MYWFNLNLKGYERSRKTNRQNDNGHAQRANTSRKRSVNVSNRKCNRGSRWIPLVSTNGRNLRIMDPLIIALTLLSVATITITLLTDKIQ